MLFDARVDEEAGWWVLSLTGELDLAAAPAVRSRIVALTADGVSRLVIDLRGVDFLDSAGLGVLVGARKRVRQLDEAGGVVRLVVTEPQVRRVLALSGLDRVMEVYEDRAAALGAVVAEEARG